MFAMKNAIVLIVFSLGASLLTHGQSAQKTLEMVDRMLKACDNHSSIQATLWRSERWKGKPVIAKADIKVEYKPYRMYMYNHLPTKNEGVELLYTEGTRGGKALVSPNGFPYTNLNLGPHGGQLRKKGAGHHSFLSLGFRYFGDMLSHYREAYARDVHKYVSSHGTTTFDGRKCFVVQLYDPDFTFVDYTVLEGENTITIASKLHVAEDMIIQKNDEVEWLLDVTPGQVIKVPTAYGKKVILHIDAETWLPVEILIYDDEGLYEHYKYLNLKVDPGFTDFDFSEQNEAYGF